MNFFLIFQLKYKQNPSNKQKNAEKRIYHKDGENEMTNKIFGKTKATILAEKKDLTLEELVNLFFF